MIEVKNLAVSHGQNQILDDVSFSVGRGELLALLGPSGAGKSTLLRAIAGLETISDGTVRFYHEEYPKLSMVFQDYALFPHLTVEENLLAALANSGETEKREMRDEFIIRILRIQNLLERRPSDISAGQRQRVGLARALLINPDIVLLDEPFANLDQQGTKELNASLRAILLRRKITAILVTHDFDEAQVFADKIAVLMSGKLQQIATSDEIYHQPMNHSVALFIGDLISIDGIISRRGKAMTAQTVFGELPIIEDHEISQGTVSLYVRPEDFHLDESGIEGEVVASTFRGEDTIVTVRFKNIIEDVELRLFWPERANVGDILKVGLRKRPYKIGPID